MSGQERGGEEREGRRVAVGGEWGNKKGGENRKILSTGSAHRFMKGGGRQRA